jgi:hypothetical protein
LAGSSIVPIFEHQGKQPAGIPELHLLFLVTCSTHDLGCIEIPMRCKPVTHGGNPLLRSELGTLTLRSRCCYPLRLQNSNSLTGRRYAKPLPGPDGPDYRQR